MVDRKQFLLHCPNKLPLRAGQKKIVLNLHRPTTFSQFSRLAVFAAMMQTHQSILYYLYNPKLACAYLGLPYTIHHQSQRQAIPVINTGHKNKLKQSQPSTAKRGKNCTTAPPTIMHVYTIARRVAARGEMNGCNM